ncbi:flagellar hook protein FlgE [Bacteroidetes/Chlorobi group bacterium Naka2016]|jgi:flagellar hook protein FlgE|nr:MAG: flagellar hook protein FlgE [Bacteroidetes/Chlorobi group bacterium Naka2016]
MGISRSLSIGTSSLRSHQRRFDVIANNIANINTTGYKASRVNFVDQFNQIVTRGRASNVVGGRGSGGNNPLQYGLGVRIGSISPDLSQGVIESTGRPLDMAIQGDGFFIYQFNGRQYFSRSAPIIRDSEGYLIDPTTGAILQGYNVIRDANGFIVYDTSGVSSLNKTLNNLQIPITTTTPPKQTENIRLSGNLNAESAENATALTSITIYDNNGTAHTLSFTFTKTANPNEWSVSAQIDGNALTIGATTITFNSDGTINTPTTLSITANDLNTALGQNVFDATTPKDINVELAPANNLLQGITQFAGANTVSFQYQDGYTYGELLDLSVDDAGKIWGSFSNGRTELMGQVALARFANPSALVREGNNMFSVGPDSGLPLIGTAGETFASNRIYSGALEQSNVDLTEEFTNMITTQRAFEAAARTITISDTMLAETNNLKR